ncbi:hypothetical protein chiPu_0010572 [Chiloscyllium punctatum]|uniref:Uncharacterized protein n=1 Tax=Chiloscyllium punctatum TaxID=137246 RepID=A0A401SNZ5_CHIPU|nr:hypothetical protein [Chiloscyllium punctatum]
MQIALKTPGALERQLSQKKPSRGTKPFPTKPYIFVNVDPNSQDVTKNSSSKAESSANDRFLTEQGKRTTDLHSINSRSKNLDQNQVSTSAVSSATKTQPQGSDAYGESIASISDHPDVTVDSSKADYESYVIIPSKTNKVLDKPKSVQDKSSPLERYRSMNVSSGQDETHANLYANISQNRTSNPTHHFPTIVNPSSLEDEQQTRSNPSSSLSQDSSHTSSVEHEILLRGNRSQALKRSPNSSTDHDSVERSLSSSTRHSPISLTPSSMDHGTSSFRHPSRSGTSSANKPVEHEMLVKGSRHSSIRPLVKKSSPPHQETPPKRNRGQTEKRMSGSDDPLPENHEAMGNMSNLSSLKTQSSLSGVVKATKHQDAQ